jgi:predicted nicotinamide N-methyase
MSQPDPPAPPVPLLETNGGDFPLIEYRLRAGERGWSVLHTSTVLTADDEERVIIGEDARLPYGVALWPSAIALAHEIAGRPVAFRGKAVLELGAGTGLPGIVAAGLGATVVQTDNHELAIHLARRNVERNGLAASVAHRRADWHAWEDAARYDWIVGADILYGESLHAPLRAIFEANLAPGGRVLLADPFRATGLKLLEALEAAGWGVSLNIWSLGSGAHPKSVGVYDLVPPSPSPPPSR